MRKNEKMNAKKNLVSVLLIASVLLFAGLVSAAELASDATVYVDSIRVADENGPAYNTAAVISGDTVEVKVRFTAAENASDVRVKVTLEGEKDDVTAVTSLFDVEDGVTYTKTLTIKVPSDLDDEVSDDLSMEVKIWNSDHETEIEDVDLRVQRESYNLAIKSISTDSKIEAGEYTSVQFVIKNVGYNDADDIYVTVSIPELNIEKSAYLGDLVSLEFCDDDCDSDDTVSGRMSLDIPYAAKSGVYTLTVTAENDETSVAKNKEVTVSNSVPELVIRSGNDLILLNPTNNIKVFTVKSYSNEVSVVVSAGSSKTVSIDTPTSEEYSFDVLVYSNGELLATQKFSGSEDSATESTSPVFVITVILAIVFFVLLVVLVVLITKKPQKTEEFGESYY